MRGAAPVGTRGPRAIILTMASAGGAPVGHLATPLDLKKVRGDLDNGISPVPISVRRLLRSFGFQRRGVFVVGTVRWLLAREGLATEPDFDAVYIDAEVRFVRAPAASEAAANAKGGGAPTASGGTAPSPDPAYTIGKLEAAGKGVVSVAPDDGISVAITRMMGNGYSQVPVMANERDVRGVVTWESIAKHLQLRPAAQPPTARACAVQARVLPSSADLFEAIRDISEHGYVLVRSGDNRITGIITGADVSAIFRELAEPFLLLAEIEQQIRLLVRGRFSQPELAASRDPGDAARAVSAVEDLTLGELARLLEKQENWKRLALSLDRGEFVRQFHAVREIRNEILHFSPDALSKEQLGVLRAFASFVRGLPPCQGQASKPA